MQKPLICLVSAQYAPSKGGVERYTQNLGLALQQMGYRVLVVTQNTQNSAQEECLDGLQVLRFPCFSLMKGRFPVPKYTADFAKCAKRLKDMSPDYMLVNTRIYLFSLYMARFAKKRNIPRILLDHSTGHMQMNTRLLSAMAQGYEHGITFFLKKQCNAFYGVSKSVCNWLKHYNIQASGVLYNAVNIEEISEYRKKTMPKNTKENTLMVLYAGRLVPEKGIQKLLKAVQNINRNEKNVTLRIAGEGPLLAELQKKKDDAVQVLGGVPFYRVIEEMEHSDVFVLPTDYPEGFPTSILEAACCGCYCITTTAGGSKELLCSREYGVILKENTSMELEKELIWAKENVNKRIQIAKNAQKQVEKQFTWQATAKAVLVAFGLEN